MVDGKNNDSNQS